MKKEIDIRTEIASAKFWKLKELLRRNINIDTKKRVLQCYVFSVFNYGCETWTFTKAVEDKRKSFEMWWYKRVLRISWEELKTNEEVLQAADVTGRLLVLDQLIKRKLLVMIQCKGKLGTSFAASLRGQERERTPSKELD
ncbi:endonuclease-reverse transcriptase [Elysia marginata]|uniref:Endonuclease-reverse transcriptase n=1 Tax=Elysia marginata TaxID=1093978 RepID=A0AAV4JD37_9GAST|nr:endonuclease-reverse transcriptase [Elysia marginata]